MAFRSDSGLGNHSATTSTQDRIGVYCRRRSSAELATASIKSPSNQPISPFFNFAISARLRTGRDGSNSGQAACRTDGNTTVRNGPHRSMSTHLAEWILTGKQTTRTSGVFKSSTPNRSPVPAERAAQKVGVDGGIMRRRKPRRAFGGELRLSRKLNRDDIRNSPLQNMV